MSRYSSYYRNYSSINNITNKYINSKPNGNEQK